MRVERLLPLQLTERCSGEQDERGEAKRGGDMRDEEREPWDGGGLRVGVDGRGRGRKEGRKSKTKQELEMWGKERKGTKQGEARGMRLPNRYELNNKLLALFK